MLTLGNFAAQPQCRMTCHTPTSKTLFFPSKIRPFSFSSNRNNHVGFFTVCGQIQNGLYVYALKSEGKDGSDLLEREEGFGYGDDDGDFEDDEELIVPLKNMKKWLENRPRGFGEGKVYDTSIEDKLMEEIEQSSKANLANINKLKNSPVKPKNEQVRQSQDKKPVESGFRVRLVNLPKKKNIDRDLRLAFKGVPGLANIIPVVSGNKKTRDPICKGLAFIDFKSKDEAFRFVQTFSGQSLLFGKIQKRIKCEIMTSSLLEPVCEQLVDGTDNDSHLVSPIFDGDQESDSDAVVHPVGSWDQSDSSDYESSDEEHLSSEWDEDGENLDKSNLPSSKGEGAMTNTSHLKQQSKVWAKEKKLMTKRKKERTSKLNIPGSANRLKIKEKVVLKGVFTKYGLTTSSAANEQG